MRNISKLSVGASMAMAAALISSPVERKVVTADKPKPNRIKDMRELYVPNSGNKYTNNGERECSRRQKQIWMGQLKVENGFKSNEAGNGKV